MMALLNFSIGLSTTIWLCVIALIAGNAVNADQCRQSCAYIPPTTALSPNQACFGLNYSAIFALQIVWDDGSYSDTRNVFSAKTVTGSCCENYKILIFGEGVVIGGRFSGENLTLAAYYSDNDRQSCNGCQLSAGLSRNLADIVLLSIGTRGVANKWIECTGNGTSMFSPAVTSAPQPVYITLSFYFDKCSDCVESC